MICRNPEKGEKAKSEIIKQCGNENVRLFLADLSIMKEIRKVAEEVNSTYDHIDVLVNNAGAINDKRIVTEDSYELTFAANHLGYFLLTKLLMTKLEASASARIINVASEAARIGKIDFEDIHLEHSYSAIKAYSQSKLANILFTFALSEILIDKNISVNALHPGVVNTNFGRNMNGFTGKVFGLFYPMMRSARKGAETTIWLATSPELEGMSGKYYKDKKDIKASKPAYDDETRKKLWKLSEQLTTL